MNLDTGDINQPDAGGDGASLRFIDAHHHLWDLSACRYPWLEARGVRRFFGDPTPIQKNYLVDDFLSESERYRPLQSVHIQVGTDPADQVAETAWLSRQPSFPHAIVAACDLASPNRDAELDQHREYSRLRGVRQILGRHAEEDRKHNSDQLIENPEFALGLSRLASLGLSFDLQLIPPQMQRVARLLSSLPDLPVALCHCGSPWNQSAAGLDHWREGLRALAALPQVVCKVSGLGMFNPAWTVDELAPIVTSVIETFGPERVMFGSNFPVDKLYRGYTELWSAYETLTRPFTAHEREQMFVTTAARFYRLD